MKFGEGHFAGRRVAQRFQQLEYLAGATTHDEAMLEGSDGQLSSGRRGIGLFVIGDGSVVVERPLGQARGVTGGSRDWGTVFG